MTPPLLEVRGLSRHFGTPARPIRAVDGVSFKIRPGETLGLVGESGCGKTTLVRTLLGLDRPTAGEVLLEGQDVFAARGAALKALRRRMQVVFQDPYLSFNPRMRVDRVLTEPWVLHPGTVPRREWPDRVADLLEQVGLRPDHARRYPGELSGGQRQRLGIARALALDPKLLICDEPVSALDVSVQAQVINLLARLRRERGLALLFVAHDLAVVRHVSDRVVVMYLGQVVETGPRDEIFARPAHPYTRALLSSVPIDDPAKRGKDGRILLQGDLPSPADPPSGCRFRTRCWKASDACAEAAPRLDPVRDRGLRTACFHPEG